MPKTRSKLTEFPRCRSIGAHVEFLKNRPSNILQQCRQLKSCHQVRKFCNNCKKMKIHSLKLTSRTWICMVGILLSFGSRPIFRGELAVSFREGIMKHYVPQLLEVSRAWSVIGIPHSKRRFSSSTVVSGIRSKTKRLTQHAAVWFFAMTIFPSSKVKPKGESTRKKGLNHANVHGSFQWFIYILYHNARVQGWTQETQHAKKKRNIIKTRRHRELNRRSSSEWRMKHQSQLMQKFRSNTNANL